MSKFGEGRQVDHSQIEIIKPLIQKAFEWYDERTPDPTILNTTHSHNIRNIIEAYDWFFSHVDNERSKKAMRGMAKFAIFHIDWDAPYAYWFYALLRKMMSYTWEWPAKNPYMWKE
jgi:hypothetical protein